MGRVRRSKRTHSNPKKNQAPGQKTRRYKRDIDQIHDDLKDGGKSKLHDTLLHNDIEELPGLGEHHCLECSRFFADAPALATHLTTKLHKRQLKKLKEEPYTIEESRRAAGLGVDKGAYGRRKEAEALAAAGTAATPATALATEQQQTMKLDA